jgi:hypothetical protein
VALFLLLMATDNVEQALDGTQKLALAIFLVVGTPELVFPTAAKAKA